MAGRRLLDAAILFNATRSIARQHLHLRQQQLRVWNKTSAVAKAAQNQTDRVTLTLQAANALADRLNQSSSPSSSSSTSQTYSKASGINAAQDIPSQNNPESSGRRKEEGVARTDISPSRGVASDWNASSVSHRVKTGPEVSPGTSSLENASSEAVPNKHSSDVANGDHASALQYDANDNLEVPDGINIDVFQGPKGKRLLQNHNKQNKSTAVKSSGISKNPYISGQSPLDSPDSAVVPSPEQISHQSSGEESLPDSTSAESIETLASDLAQDSSASPKEHIALDQKTAARSSGPPRMHESRVPASRIGRLWQYGGLATGMAFGAVGETFRRAAGGGNSGASLMLSAGNMERLVAKLSRMRGAALKLGQMMSFQDSKMLPGPIHEVLQRVQDNADYMPPSQRDRVLTSNLGADWRNLFSGFDEVPMAAASIGQVHRAKLASNGIDVAVKIQYPGVATSIDSDLNNLSILLTASRLLPRGLFLDKTIANARTELAWECDYRREAACQARFKELLSDETDTFTVPAVFKEASGPQVLTAEFMSGTAVTKPSLNLSQEQRDWIGTNILRLCLRELTEFNFMQTDPNWTNFLYNKSTKRLELLDFGAARDYPPEFVDPYVLTLIASAAGDDKAVRDLSVQLGYLTGEESKKMVDAHLASVMTLAEPFLESEDINSVYDFRDQTITDRVRAQIPIMLRERLSPPPEETYSLHRKLSGAFLLLARLGSQVKCREMFVEAVNEWKARKRRGEGGSR